MVENRMDATDATINRDIARESLTAIDVLRTAKNAFFWLAVVAILLHLFAWLGSNPAGAAATAPAADSAVTDASAPDAARVYARVLESRLTLVGFVGRASVLICAGAYIICLLISLVGRIGGTVGLAKACVWSLAALAMVTPWVGAEAHQIAAFRSAFFDGDELYSFADGLISFIRFVLCPLLVIFCLFLAQWQFRTAYRKVTRPGGGRLPIHEV